MAINIQSLFSDIIETPAQSQQRMLTEGILRGRELTGGLTGLARTQAPLVSALSMQMPQRQEVLRRNVGGMLGLDVRTESEKLQDILRQADTSTPGGMIELSRAIENIAPAQALTLRQAATEQQMKTDKEMQERANELRRGQNIIRYAQGLISDNPDLANLLPNLPPEEALNLAREVSEDPDRNIFLETITTEEGERKLVMFDKNDPDFREDVQTLAPEEDELEIKPLTSSEQEIYLTQMNSVEEMKVLRGAGLAFAKVDDALLYDRLASVRAENPDKTPRQHVEMLAQQINEELSAKEASETQQAQEIAGGLDGNALDRLSDQAAAARASADSGVTRDMMDRLQMRSDVYASGVIPPGRR